MFDITSTVEQLFSVLDNNFSKAAKFSPRINLIPPLISSEGYSHQIKGDSIFFDGVWMTHPFYEALNPPPKTFHKSEGDIKEDHLKEIEKKLESITGTLDLKKELAEVRNLSEKYLDKPNTEDGKKLTTKWKAIEQDHSAAVASRENALLDLDKVIGEELADKIKICVLAIPDPKDALLYIMKHFKTFKTKDVKKEKEQGYVPEFDKDKKEFTKEDIKYILGVIKEKHASGIAGVTNPLKKLFNGDLINSLLLAYRKYEGMEGLVNFLKDYSTKKKQLKETPPLKDLPSNIDEIFSPAENAIDLLENMKSSHPSDYKGSFFEYTEELLKILLKYLRHGEKVNEFEALYLEALISGMTGDNDGVIKQWSKLSAPDIYNNLKELRNLLSGMFYKTPDTPEKVDKDFKDIDKRKKLLEISKNEKSSHYKELARLVNKAVVLTDEDKELMKEMKDETKKTEKGITDKGMSDKEIKEEAKKYKEYQKKKKEQEKEEKEKYAPKKKEEEKKLSPTELKEKREQELKDQEEKEKTKKKEDEEKAKQQVERWQDAEKEKDKVEQKRKEQQEADKKKKKEDTKKSSELSLLTRIETLGARSGSALIKAELGDILAILKTAL